MEGEDVVELLMKSGIKRALAGGNKPASRLLFTLPNVLPALRQLPFPASELGEDFEEAGDEDVFRKIRKDLDSANVSVSDEEIRKTMLELLAKAVEAVQNS